jgi:hypothetical protein
MIFVGRQDRSLSDQECLPLMDVSDERNTDEYQV